MNLEVIPGQMTVDDCVAEANEVEILILSATALEPSYDCHSATLSCPCWADCEIAGRCLGDIDE